VLLLGRAAGPAPAAGTRPPRAGRRPHRARSRRAGHLRGRPDPRRAVPRCCPPSAPTGPPGTPPSPPARPIRCSGGCGLPGHAPTAERDLLLDIPWARPAAWTPGCHRPFGHAR
jgi:hypothetical protein